MKNCSSFKICLKTGTIVLLILSLVVPMVFGTSISKPDKFIIVDSEKTNKQEDVIQPVDGPMDSAWPMFQHDTKHTGRSPFGDTGNLGVLKWKFKMDGTVDPPPIIGEDETIYIGGADYFYAIHPNGSVKWRYEFKYGAVDYGAAIDENGTIYFGTMDADYNYFYSLNYNGTLKWKYPIGHHVRTSPIIGGDGTIYFGSDNKNIYALYPNGTLKWKFKTGGLIQSSPAIDDDGIIYCGSSDHYLYAFYPNGTVKWKFDAGSWAGGDAPTIGDDGTIYFGSVEGVFYALYHNGSRKWRLTLGCNVVSSSALAENGTLYVAAYKPGITGAYIYSINPNGTINWRYEVEDEAMSASPAIDKYGIIYVGGWRGSNPECGNLYALNPDGTLRWFFHTGDSIYSSAAIGEDGTVYFGSWDRYLYAIKIIDNDSPEKPSIDGPFSGNPRTEYIYTAVASDPDGDNVSYFFDWGDGSSSGWTEFVPSGVSVNCSHSWRFRGSYVVKVRAKDDYGFLGDWSKLEVKIPKVRQVSYNFYLRFFEKNPFLFSFLKQLLNFY